MTSKQISLTIRDYVWNKYLATYNGNRSAYIEDKFVLGCEIDLDSNKSLTKVLHNQMGIDIPSFTKKGNPQWTNMGLMALAHPVGRKIAEYKRIRHFTSTYCDGFLDRIGDDGRIHTDFKIADTRTGRLSCKNPNMMNLPADAEIFVIPDDGHCFIAFDYSQIEYRIFGHYANDEYILGQYKNNSNVDFHQTLAHLYFAQFLSLKPHPTLKKLILNPSYGLVNFPALEIYAPYTPRESSQMQLY